MSTNLQKTFEQLRDRFKACERQDASLIELRLIERSWIPNPDPEHSGVLHDFSEYEASSGWTLVEQHEFTGTSGECHQLSLYVLHRNLVGPNRETFERWKSFAEFAGNELARVLPSKEGREPVQGVCGWVWWIKHLASEGNLPLRMTSSYVDQELWLSAIEAEREQRPEATELLKGAERHGIETICTDAVTASILVADWLALNGWPFPSGCEDPSGQRRKADDAESELRQTAKRRSSKADQEQAAKQASERLTLPTSHQDTTYPDDKILKRLRKDSPSRVKARAAFDYAMERIPNANKMTAAELFDAIIANGEAKDMLPPNSETFTKYLNDCGIRLRKSDTKDPAGSVVRWSDL